VIQLLFPVATQIHQAITVTVAQKNEHCLVHVIDLPLLFLNRHFLVFRDGAISGPGGEPERTTLLIPAFSIREKKFQCSLLKFMRNRHFSIGQRRSGHTSTPIQGRCLAAR
jgi:hypothetical protein